ncbi:hypothetical protein HH310_22360 [Actinoplanes sp. TBRC 11911]|uniref:hypothetical protein n=1 Tax=Actinoplanes sp. TBRC 11911 TaxID=2729386 RepID=UPI00145CC869|nr:hypothetical protein [Actinoplanes sp. TBRC 11911]NMO53911.1 hypothetical protein [Actinoplanes sp. TBRC 11911]
MARDVLGSQDPTPGDSGQAEQLPDPMSELEQTRIVVVFEDALTDVPGPDETQVVVPESTVTSIIRVDAPAKKPVFVDPSGRRGRRVRRWAYGIGVLVLLIVAAAWVVQLDGWAKPPTPASSVAK